jgi:hypothetical protein
LTFRQNIARYVTGEISETLLPNIAIEALEAGLDSPTLRILAGLSDNENGFVIETYFKETLRELNIELPNKRQASIEVGIAYIESIIEGKKSIFDGALCIKWYMLDTYPFFDESIHYCYDSIYFDKAYGLFDSLDDLRNAGSTQWQAEKTNEQLEREISEELMTELKRWHQKMKNGR